MAAVRSDSDAANNPAEELLFGALGKNGVNEDDDIDGIGTLDLILDENYLEE